MNRKISQVQRFKVHRSACDVPFGCEPSRSAESGYLSFVNLARRLLNLEQTHTKIHRRLFFHKQFVRVRLYY